MPLNGHVVGGFKNLCLFVQKVDLCNRLGLTKSLCIPRRRVSNLRVLDPASPGWCARTLFGRKKLSSLEEDFTIVYQIILLWHGSIHPLIYTNESLIVLNPKIQNTLVLFSIISINHVSSIGAF